MRDHLGTTEAIYTHQGVVVKLLARSRPQESNEWKDFIWSHPLCWADWWGWNAAIFTYFCLLAVGNWCVGNLSVSSLDFYTWRCQMEVLCVTVHATELGEGGREMWQDGKMCLLFTLPMLQPAFFCKPQFQEVSAVIFTFCLNICNHPVWVAPGPEVTQNFVVTIPLRGAALTRTLFSQVCKHLSDFGQVSHWHILHQACAEEPKDPICSSLADDLKGWCLSLSLPLLQLLMTVGGLFLEHFLQWNLTFCC